MRHPSQTSHVNRPDPSLAVDARDRAANDGAAPVAPRRPRHLDCSESPHEREGLGAAARSTPSGRTTRQPRR
jgi:hypothetical protein